MSIFKPPFGARINWDHPLSKGLVGCFLFNEGSGSVVCNIANPEYSGTIHNSGNDIVEWVVGGLENYETNGEDYVDLGSFLSFDNGISIAISTKVTNLENYDRIIQRASADGAGWSLRYYNNSFAFQDKKISASNNVLTDSTVSAGIEYFVVATSDRVSTTNIYLDTVAGTSTFSDDASDGGGTDIDIFRRANQAGNAYLGFIRFVFLWDRELSKDEIILLNADPYCFIECWDIGAFEYVTTGGATAAISDTITLSESLTSIGKYKAAAIDSIGFGETVTTLARLLGTISDIVNLADTADVSSAIAGVIQDTLALSDTLSALAGFKGSLADTINLAESLTVLAAWKIAINDSLALSDNARTTLIASIVDSLGLADTAAGLTGYKSSIADTINFGDTASSLRSLVAAAVDSLDFVTSVTGIVNDPGGLTATVLDTLGFSDSIATLGNYQVELVDGVDLNDATAALTNYIQSIIDTIGLTDRAEIITAIGKVNVTFILKVPGTTFKLKVPGTTFTLK